MTEPASPTAIALLALMSFRGVGRRAALRVVTERLDSSDGKPLWDLVRTKLKAVRVSEGELVDAWKQAEQQTQDSADAGVLTFSLYDDRYPARLKRISDPPAVLFVRGSADGLKKERSVAIVGTREPTPYGAKVARRCGQNAAEIGWAIVSGLAHGCDTLAHEGCLDSRGTGVAVLAHGLDKVYPAANRQLADRLLDGGGCLVSEYPIGKAPIRAAFAERDRIQSGLSDCVVVIETDIKGGTMHTVNFSREQGRPLACIAHPPEWISSDKARGNQQLITQNLAVALPDGDSLQKFLLAAEVGARPSAETRTDAASTQRSWAF